MSKIKSITTGIALGTALLVLGGCASSQSAQAPAGQFKDGIYFAQEDKYSDAGWKYVVTLEVKDSKIASVDWNGAYKAGGADKDSLSKAGKYGMKAGGAQAEWHEEAEKAEAYLLKTQDPKKIEYKDEKGHSDTITGATISVKPLFALAEKALANGPVEKGPYKDGAYYAEESTYHPEWKYTTSLTVINGNVVAADWNGVSLYGGKDKDTLSKDGEYGMKAGGASAEWHEQAEKVEAYFLANQDPTKITYKDEKGHSDTISGATMGVKYFFDLAKAALDKGPIAEGPYKDGFYYAQLPKFSEGFKYMAHIAVNNGTIVGVDFNGIAENKEDPDKDTFSKSGKYGMKAAGAQAEWHEQVEKAEAYLIQTQDPAKITFKDDAGHTDAITGATIKVKDFFTLAQEALKSAK